jgi:hypothetical protein
MPPGSAASCSDSAGNPKRQADHGVDRSVNSNPTAAPPPTTAHPRSVHLKQNRLPYLMLAIPLFSLRRKAGVLAIKTRRAKSPASRLGLKQ